MKCRRAVLLAILLYVTLDLSVPTIPGAFVFESVDSVEISSGRGGQGEAEISVLPAPAGDPFGVSQTSFALGDRVAANSNVALPGHPMLNRLPRATLDPAPPSEDPH